jgi:hypothetical protein
MFKWVSWVIRMGATALLLSFLCIWTTGYIVNSYMESAVKQLGLPFDIQPIALSGVWGTLWGADKPAKKEIEANRTPSQERSSGEQTKEESSSKDSVDDSDMDEIDPSSGDGAKRESEASQAESQSPEPPPSPSEAGGAWTDGGATTGGGDEGVPEQPVQGSDAPQTDEAPNGSIPVFQAESAWTQLSDEDRQSLYSLVVSKLNQEQLQQLSDALKDGLTAEELTSLQEMLKSALTEAEYAQIMGRLLGRQTP